MPWDLYLLDPETLHVERVLANVWDPSRLHWSPDSQWLVYNTERGNNQAQGVWLFSLQTRKQTLVHAGEYWDMAWSPDGRALLVVQCRDTFCQTAAAWKYDVSSIVTPPK